MRRVFLSAVSLVVLLVGCSQNTEPEATQSMSDQPVNAAPEARPAADPSGWPLDEELPLPPEGWYKLNLAGEESWVFRDEYGIPHVFANTKEGAFRAQGYVIMEDRCRQTLLSQIDVRGFRSLREGESGLGHDRYIRQKGYTEEELQAQVDALRPDLRLYLESYIEGVNAYLEKVAPHLEPIQAIDVAAGAFCHMSSVGDWGGDELDVLELVRLAKFFRGEEFMYQILNDAIPLDVPCAPTTDHSHKKADGNVAAAREYPRRKDYDPAALMAVLELNEEEKRHRDADGLVTTWGSFAWLVSPQRSATGHAMLFGAPMINFPTPAPAAQVHLVAPGLNVIGMAFHGTPGVQFGHNDRIAWATTSSLLNATDYFEEELHPDDRYRYKYNGEWKEMEAHQMSIPVREKDGSIRMEPFTAYRTVHGPVMQWDDIRNKAYTRSTSIRNLELRSMMSFIDMDLAQNLDDVEAAIRHIATTHNFFAADVDGNIGYWLTGRFPVRHPDQDPRLLTPGTGEYDWRGFTNGVDWVKCVNPPEGWLANANNKPSVKTPSWFPEATWAIKIFESLESDESVTWDELIAINQANGEFNFIASYFKPYLIDVLRERGGTHPEWEGEDYSADISCAIALLEEWPNKDVPGATAALIMNEWVKELLVQLLSPDFGPIVKRDMNIDNLRLFATIAFRVLLPERAGIELRGDYLHGRDKDEVALDALKAVLARLKKEHGPDMAKWPFDPGCHKFGDLLEVPKRNVGTYWQAVELADTIRAADMLTPGQSGISRSPHYLDQVDLFRAYEFKQPKFLPEEFEFPVATARAAFSGTGHSAGASN